MSLFHQDFLQYSWPSINRATFNLTGLKAYWKFNESSGNIINQRTTGDGLGSAADITTSGVTYSQTGKIGNAISWDGVNDTGTIGSSTSQFNFMHNTSALFTFCCWYKIDTMDGTFRTFFNTADNLSTGDTGIAIQRDGGDAGGRQCRFLFGNAGTFTTLTSSNTFLPNDTTGFHFLVVRYDEGLGSNNLNISVDNGTPETINKSGTRTDSDHTAAGQLGNITGAHYFNGDFDETSLWNRWLSDAEVTSLYNSGNGLEL